MAVIRPFPCVRPAKELASRVAALPYDVYSRAEAKAEAGKEPLSFLNIDRPETQFEETVDMYSERVYQKARELFEQQVGEGVYIEDNVPCYYLYELVMDGRSQDGIVACASIDDYQSGVIKKHENTREEKEQDRIRHVTVMDAQTGPIFLTYRSEPVINEIMSRTKMQEAEYDFTSEDGITHRVWAIDALDDSRALEEAFRKINQIYIADGHHRAASAVKVGLNKREQQPGYTGEEEFNYFLSVLFPHDQLKILPYNRVVADLNGLSIPEFLNRCAENFEVKPWKDGVCEPDAKGIIGMYLDGRWYRLRIKDALRTSDPVEGLDVSLLQDHLLAPVLGIEDPRTDKRIDFVGGIRGSEELERRVCDGMAAAFAMYPTSIEELLAVADAGRLMPPKSTWFEPKLRSGLFIHRLS
ncbi:DUF1015 domain-containing protein [Anaerolentibacter hominis]|uniref:DUF1015 domain-containing protein n=1 Tax=Anaerolentibacter hominis TaxID=3079009 RepID=UPI0031B8848A